MALLSWVTSLKLKLCLLMRRRLSNAYGAIHRLSDAYDHNLKKKINFVIFGRFKRKNPCAIGINRRILDRNVVVRRMYLGT